MKPLRTTLTLDPEVASLLQRILRKKQISAKELINRALHRGLLEWDKKVQVTPVQTEPYDAGRLFVPDLSNVGEVLSLLDENEPSAPLRPAK